jgi:hypothetical protein
MHLQWMPIRQHAGTAGTERVAIEPQVVAAMLPFRDGMGRFVPLLPQFHAHVQPVAGARNKRPRLVADVWQQGVADVVQAGGTVKEAVALKAATIMPSVA